MSAYSNGTGVDSGAAAYEVARFDYHDTGRAAQPVSIDDAAGNPVSVPASPESWSALGGAYAVLVVCPGGKYRRRLYLALDSAQRQVDRARARGEHARLVLVRLTPAGEVN